LHERKLRQRTKHLEAAIAQKQTALEVQTSPRSKIVLQGREQFNPFNKELFLVLFSSPSLSPFFVSFFVGLLLLFLLLRLLWSYKNPTHRRTGRKAAKPKEVFPEQEQKKLKKTSTTRKETHKTKSRERQEALQNASTVNCLFLAATDRRNEHKNISSLLLRSFLPSSTYICLFFIHVIFLHFIGGVFVEEFGLELLPRMMIRPSPTSITTPVRPTKQQNIHRTTKNSCRTPVHGTDTTD
jgi:hypothetical protein